MENTIPKLLLGDELKQALQVLPEYDASIRNASTSERLIALTRICDIFYPSPMACEIYSKLYFAYINAIKRKYNYNLGLQAPCGIMGNNDSFSIIGASGIGKSSAIGRAIYAISQDKIVNINNGKVIPFLVVQTPSDASIKGLLLEILRLVDEHLGTSYHNDAIRSRATLDMLIGLSSKVFFNHIGVIVLDEIQNLVGTKSGYSLVKSIVQMVNASSISICFVGTFEVVSFFESFFHLARRSIGLSYDGLKNDECFENLCQTLYKYQYTKNYVPLTHDTINWLYIHSQGVLAIVVGLIYSAQQIAILEGRECLNIQTLHQAYQERFGMLHTHLDIPSRNGCYSKTCGEELFLDVLKTHQINSEPLSLVEVINTLKKQNKDIMVHLRDYISVEELAL